MSNLSSIGTLKIKVLMGDFLILLLSFFLMKSSFQIFGGVLIAVALILALGSFFIVLRKARLH